MPQLSDREIEAFWREKLALRQRPFDVTGPKGKTVLELFEETVKRSGFRTAVECLDHEMSFQELDERTDAFALFLLDEPYLQKGDRIALMLPNCQQFFVALLGTIKAGMVAVPCNPLYTKEEIAHQLKDSEAKVLIALENILPAPLKAIVDPATRPPQLKKLIVTSLGDGLPRVKGLIVDGVVKYVKKMIPKENRTLLSKCLSLLPIQRYASLFRGRESQSSSQQSRLQVIQASIGYEDLMVIAYTGGTTGVSKGCMLTHKSLLCDAFATFDTVAPEVKERIHKLFASGQNAYYFMPLPMYHVYTLAGVFAYTFYYGLSSLTLPNPREIPAVIKLFSRPNICFGALIDTLVGGILRHPQLSTLTIDKKAILATGGMPASVERMRLWEEKTGVPLIEGYGLSEASPLVFWNVHSSTVQGSIGLPLPETLVKLVDDDGNDLPLGAGDAVRGELWVKGPQVMKGYFHKEQETKQVLTAEGWLKTGDIVTMDAAGYVRIVDRKKDMIIVSGFKVYPSELEEKAMALPLAHIKECAAIGEADPETGERVVLYVSPEDPKADPAIIENYLKTELAKVLTNYKRPAEIRFMQDLPKSPVGKILKKELRRKN